MSRVETNHARNRNLFRLVAALTVGAMLMSSAYTAAFAGGAHTAGYPDDGGGGGGDDDDDDGLSTGEKVAIGVGGAAAAAAIYYFVIKDDDDDDSASRPMPSGTRASALRLVPQTRTVEAGTTVAFDVQARSAKDGRWYNVTGSPDTSIRASGSLIRTDGTRNVFALPVTAPRSEDGKSVEVTGTFGGLSAATRVAVSVPGS